MTKELTETIAKALVDNPSQVSVREEVSGKDVSLILSVDPADMGKIIGKQGRIANAIRTVVKAASVKEGRRVDVEIV
ncbi:MAG: KH domain-containing protein [Lachnospiraceae bacterium]|nr:KH domain-containing protein [Lachnospiraceae bacterium]